MAKQKPSGAKIAAHFATEDAARAYLEAIRWPSGAVCPKCGSASRPYALKGGKYRCSVKDCRSDFTVRVGTVFESSHIPLHKWLLAAYFLCSSKKGTSSHQLHRIMGVTYKTAWFMSHRIREAMKARSLITPMGGPGNIVEVGETLIGRDLTKKPYGQKKGCGYAHKVQGSVAHKSADEAGDERCRRCLKKRTLRPILERHIHAASTIMTDEADQYTHLDVHFARRGFVRDGENEYVRGDIHISTAEGFFSVFKRGMKGLYQHCSSAHLHRYVVEFDFRYNERDMSDSERTAVALR